MGAWASEAPAGRLRVKQGAIAAHVGLTRATVNRILKRHAATGSLVPGKS